MDRLKELLRRAGEAIRSPRGRDVLMFMLFLFISAVLWGVLALNEEEQYDLRMPVRITHVPDSVTLLSKGPDAIRGWQRGNVHQNSACSHAKILLLPQRGVLCCLKVGHHSPHTANTEKAYVNFTTISLCFQILFTACDAIRNFLENLWKIGPMQAVHKLI